MPRTYAASTLNSSAYRIKFRSAAPNDAGIFYKRIYELRNVRLWGSKRRS